MIKAGSHYQDGVYRIVVLTSPNQRGYELAISYIRSLFHQIRVRLTYLVDCYHVRCFEQIPDFSHAAYLDPLRSLYDTRTLLSRRKDYQLDSGGSFIAQTWKTLMCELIHERDRITLAIDEDSEAVKTLRLSAATFTAYMTKKRGFCCWDILRHISRCRCREMKDKKYALSSAPKLWKFYKVRLKNKIVAPSVQYELLRHEIQCRSANSGRNDRSITITQA